MSLPGPWVGFCSRCRNKVRQPYATVVKDRMVHRAKVRYRHPGGDYSTVECRGPVQPGNLKQIQKLQDDAGFKRGFDRFGRTPFIDGNSEGWHRDV